MCNQLSRQLSCAFFEGPFCAVVLFFFGAFPGFLFIEVSHNKRGPLPFRSPPKKNKKNKKVLLRERKRHTARRVAIASPCYSGGGGGGAGSLDKKFFSQSEYVSFFPSLNMNQAKSGVKKFSLYWMGWGWGGGGGGSLDKKILSQSKHVSSQIWCQKFFPLLGEGGPLTKISFFQTQHVSCKIWCQKIFPLLGGGVPLQKFFSPV